MNDLPPLAERMRPRSLSEVVGQDHLCGPDGPLRRAVEGGALPSMILWGPPGCGKTSLAVLLAEGIEAELVRFSAVLSGVRELRQVCGEARERRARGERTVLFVDEVHRFHKGQQDAFLPFVERGDVVLIGATTENPSFALNAALLSRVVVFTLRPLSAERIREVLEKAVEDRERGLGRRVSRVEDEALEVLVRLSGGDLRRGLTFLEGAVLGLPGNRDRLTREDVERFAQRPVLLHDKSGDTHFDLLSAFHKSLRNSDPDAALFWMVRMLEAGEDPLVLCRRMVAFAAEDVGIADPQALQVAMRTVEAVRFLGLPEGRLAMGCAAVYLALAPRSNAVYRALRKAAEAVREHPGARVPKVLRNAPTELLRSLGHGRGYLYAHDLPEGIAAMDCLPEELSGRRFFEPGSRGFEVRVRRRMEEIAALKAGRREKGTGNPPSGRGDPGKLPES